MVVDSDRVKQYARDIGSDLCGIASVERFSDSPRGFHPKDIYPGTKSIIVIAKRFPRGSMQAMSPVPYTFASDQVLSLVYQITIGLLTFLEEQGSIAVPIPSVPYEYWDEETSTGKGIISLRHAGYLAGLGIFGRNSLLYHEKYGNCITLGAVLTNAVLTPDPIAAGNMCSDECSLCLNNCPGKALTGTGVIQQRCRPHSSGETKRGEVLYTCHLCRSLCPNCSSIKHVV